MSKITIASRPFGRDERFRVARDKRLPQRMAVSVGRGVVRILKGIGDL
jgi:hypothetical protein